MLTGTFLAPNNKTLFRIVSNIHGKNWVDFSDETINALNLNTVSASVNQGIKKLAHTIVKQLVAFY